MSGDDNSQGWRPAPFRLQPYRDSAGKPIPEPHVMQRWAGSGWEYRAASLEEMMNDELWDYGAGLQGQDCGD